jgi:hypothetical protein
MNEIGIRDMSKDLWRERVAAAPSPGDPHHLDTIDQLMRRQDPIRRTKKAIKSHDADGEAAITKRPAEIGDNVFKATPARRILTHDLNDADLLAQAPPNGGLRRSHVLHATPSCCKVNSVRKPCLKENR